MSEDRIPPQVERACVELTETLATSIDEAWTSLMEHGFCHEHVAIALLATLHSISDHFAGQWFGTEVKETFRLAREAAAEVLDTTGQS